MKNHQLKLSFLLNDPSYTEEIIAYKIVERGIRTYCDKNRNNEPDLDTSLRFRMVCCEMDIAIAIKLLRVLSKKTSRPFEIGHLRKMMASETFGKRHISPIVDGNTSAANKDLIEEMEDYWRLNNTLLKEMILAVLYTLESETEDPTLSVEVYE